MELLFLSFFSVVMILDVVSIFVFLSVEFLWLFVSMKHDFFFFLGSGKGLCESMSFGLIMLSIWIIILMNLSMLFFKEYDWILALVMIILFLGLVLLFIVMDLIFFYIFFEACLVPTFLLILGWGYQPERIRAGVYMLLYTVFGSLPLLFLLLLLSSKNGSSEFLCMESFSFISCKNFLLWGFGLLAFLVKLPLYFLHLWLPKAHVEAPVAGSMVLAGVLLKLGGYGIYRVVPFLGGGIFFPVSLMVWGLVGGLVVSLFCLYQTDMKCLIALSSVAHMSVVLGSFLVKSEWGVNSAFYVMIGHGFCSSGLFCVVNMVYDRSLSRSMSMVNGVQLIFPMMGLLGFLLMACNMSAPPSLSLLGEIIGITSLGNWSFYLFLVLFFLIFFSASYSLFLYEEVKHGKSVSFLGSAYSLNNRELMLLLMHLLPLNVVFLISFDVM